MRDIAPLIAAPFILIPVRGYRIAMAFGGEATPPITRKGALVKKNDHFCCFAHSSLKASKSHNSPIGVPHWHSSHSCKQQFSGYGQASNPIVSPATAEKCLEYSQRTVSSVLAIPIIWCWSLVPNCRVAASASLKSRQRTMSQVRRSPRRSYLCHLTKPVRRMNMSPGLHSVPWLLRTSSISETDTAWLLMADGGS